ncbi:hypothetical protein PG984_011600 [Apiospora sp. TS-2023a]
MVADTGDVAPAAGMGRITLRQRERSARGQGIDQYFFDRKFDDMQIVKEATSYLEILNYTVGHSTFPSMYSIQQDAGDEKTFSPKHISLPKDSYRAMMDKFHLPLQALETSTVVGPFFWWAHDEKFDGKHLPANSVSSLEMVFRKSDVKWMGNPRGWQMILSYSFATRVTSGFLKGTKNANLGEIISQLKGCASPAHHPLLLPILMLCQELGASNDEKQKEIRNGIRELDMTLTGNYRGVPAAAGHISHGDLTLDKISQRIADYQAKVNWKRPQAWRNALGKIKDATEWVCENGNDPFSDIGKLHISMMDRLRFYNIKLDGLENYAHVSLARLDNLRQVTNGLISQVESRLNAEIAIQQHILANASKRDSASMKTLTMLGAVFLPGTFLSSMFSMPFFEFHDMSGPVSRSLWIYIVLTVPLTGLVVLIWWWIDQRMARRFSSGFGVGLVVDEDGKEDEDNGAEEHLNRLEGQILERIRHRTGAHLTRTFTLTRSHHSRPSRRIVGVEAGDVVAAAAAVRPPSKRGKIMRHMARGGEPPRDIEL